MNNFDLPPDSQALPPQEPGVYENLDSEQTPVIEVNDNGHKLLMSHLKITDEQLLNSTDIIQPDALVTIFPGGSEELTIPFTRYLQSLGFSNYEAYQKYCSLHPEESQDDIFRQAQREFVERRLKRNSEIVQHRKSKPENVKSLENAERSTKEDAVIWRKMINNLGLPEISAVSATDVNDNIDGIDEYLKLDLSELGLGAENQVRYIGIQRSFLNKEEDVKKKHINYLPESPDIGVVFRVFSRDQSGDYDIFDKVLEGRAKKIATEASATNQSVIEYIETQAAKKGIGVKKYMDERLERIPIEKFLTGGELQEIRWVEDVLTKTLYQLETYRREVQGWDADCLSKDIEGLKKTLIILADLKLTVEIQTKEKRRLLTNESAPR